MGWLSWLFGRRRGAEPAVLPRGDDSILKLPRYPDAVISRASAPAEAVPNLPLVGGPSQVVELSETHVGVLGPGGVFTVMDREAFEYANGRRAGGDPRQRDLDAVLGRADRVRVYAGGAFRGAPRPSDLLLDLDDPAALADLRDCLRIDEDPATFGHCQCLGGPAVELLRGDEPLATLGVHHGLSVRWSSWRHDARLVGNRRLDAWMTDKGVESDLLRLIQENGYQPGPVRPLPPRALTPAEQRVCLAEAAARAGDLERAQSHLAEALAAEPGLPLAHVVRGLIHRDAGNHPAAVRDLTVALESGFRHPEVLFQRALAMDEMGHPREAADDCTAALEIDPEHAGALNLRGYVRSLHGPADEALPDLVAAARLAPGWHVPRFHRGCLHHRRGEFAEAVGAFGDALAVLRDNAPPAPPEGDDPSLKPAVLLLWWRAESARAVDNVEAAEADIALARERDAYWAAGIGGDLLNQLGEHERAEAEFTAAIGLRPEMDEPYLGRALARLRGGRPAEAVADYDVVVNRRPGAAMAYGLRAQALAAAGRFPEALADCEARQRLTPGDPSVHLDRGRVHVMAGAFDRARDEFEAAAMLAAHHPVVSAHLVWVLAAAGDGAVRDAGRAETFGRVACEVTRWQDPWLLEALAAAQAEAGRFDEAVETQQKALDARSGPPSEDALFRLRRYQNRQPFRMDAGAGLPWP
jgi:tetratricopeptide (TPR) repeat protein